MIAVGLLKQFLLSYRIDYSDGMCAVGNQENYLLAPLEIYLGMCHYIQNDLIQIDFIKIDLNQIDLNKILEDEGAWFWA
ncbi:MAG: hypothetical protein IJL09_07245 [Lachnospiraceae bacterium]|nr:hypothetical protein [Lachnospiraceae bacterium]